MPDQENYAEMEPELEDALRDAVPPTSTSQSHDQTISTLKDKYNLSTGKSVCVETSGGAVINESVNVEHGDFVGRDKVIQGDQVYRNKIVAEVIHVHYNSNSERISPSASFTFAPPTILIPAGEFLMGRQPDQGVAPYETPAHTVYLPAYHIGLYPVTNLQYVQFVRQTKRPIVPELGWDGRMVSSEQFALPVVGITWYDAIEYCTWLSLQTEHFYRLPTEAEWEKAASGNYGCQHMVGGVREWTCTLWGEQPRFPNPRFAYPWPANNSDDGRNHISASSHFRRIYRGGPNSTGISPITPQTRNSALPNQVGPPGKRYGFRVVQVIS